MKLKWIKIITFCLCVLLLCGAFTACREKDLAIEGKTWSFSIGVDKDGKVIYCTRGNSASYPDAKAIALSCKAVDGVLTISEGISGEVYTGSYSFEKSGKDYDSYHVEFSTDAADHGDHVHEATKDSGHANISCVKTPDGTKTYTMTISLSEVTLTFFAPYES